MFRCDPVVSPKLFASRSREITPLCGKPKTREQNGYASGSVSRRLDFGENRVFIVSTFCFSSPRLVSPPKCRPKRNGPVNLKRVKATVQKLTPAEQKDLDAYADDVVAEITKESHRDPD
jgi:hypothetical protein